MSKRDFEPGAAVRMRVMKRDKFQCTYCGVPGTDAELECDHIIPLAKGGSHHMSNLTTACRACNKEKGVKNAKTVQRIPVSRNTDHPLVHMCMHTLDAEGHIEMQGEIISVDGEVVLVQLFEWMMGSPTEVRVFQKSFIYSDKVKLYSSDDLMNRAWEAEQMRRFPRQFKGSIPGAREMLRKYF